MNEHSYEELEQYDIVIEEYIDRVADKYSRLIGLFLIEFSKLEHELNVTIADALSEHAHDMGYMVIENLSMKNKIDLFYKFYLWMVTIKEMKSKDILDKIRLQLENINTFRNSIVHANWQTLSRNGYVRTKIVIDNQEGYIKFKKVNITTKLITHESK